MRCHGWLPLFLSVAGACVLPGCEERVAFIKTASDFIAAPRSSYPAVYLDRKPELPYRPVGIIQTQGRLSEVISEVKEMGRELGCDVIVDRRIHQVNRMSPEEAPRWVVDLTPMRRRSAPEPHQGAAGRETASMLGYPSAYQPAPYVAPTYVTHNVVVPQAQEFICGLFVEEHHDSATSGAPRTAVPPSSALWDMFVAERDGKAACRVVADVLAEDANCTGAQCVAPLVLSNTFVSRCQEHDAENTARFKELQARWKVEAGASTAGPCFGRLLRATRSRAAAKQYQDQCLADRERGFIETRILLRAAKPERED